MKITSGEYEVFDSGSIITYGEKPLSFHFEENTGNFNIEVVFEEDPSKEEADMRFSNNGNITLTIHLVNVNDTIPVRSNRPVHLGSLHDRELFLVFSCYNLGPGVGKSFQYTWYLEKAD